jgi:predicted PurR-regulated permease PerM
VQSTLSGFGLEGTVNLADLFEEGMSRIANLIMSASSAFVAHIPTLLVSLFIYSAALYFFLAEAKSLRRLFNRLRLLEPTEANRLVHLLQRSCYTTVLTSVLIGLLQATIVGLGTLLLDGGDFGVVWVITFFFSFIPVVGAGPVALILGLLKLISAHYGQALGFLIVAIVGGTMDNIIRPFLISSGDQDLHPVVSSLAIIGALMIFGMPGLFLGPVIASVAVKIVPTLYPPEVRDL